MDSPSPPTSSLGPRRVSIDHFDPTGIAELSRSLSRQSSTQSRRVEFDGANTLVEENGPDDFDFERFLKWRLNTVKEAGINIRQLGVVFKVATVNTNLLSCYSCPTGRTSTCWDWVHPSRSSPQSHHCFPPPKNCEIYLPSAIRRLRKSYMGSKASSSLERCSWCSGGLAQVVPRCSKHLQTKHTDSIK